MTEPLVSILINCYNGEKYLSEAVESVLAQTYKNWEIIFWDNQSTDSSAEKFQEYAKKDDRLRYFYAGKHTLLYGARNLAIKKTRGEFIAILDVDDWWHQRKLEMQVPLFSDVEIGMVYGNYWLVKEGKKELQYKKDLPSGEILRNLLKDYCIGMLTMVVRKSIFEELNISFNNKYQIIGDFDFSITVAQRKKIGVVQEPIAYYRKHLNSLSSTEFDKPIVELQEWIKNSNLKDEDLNFIKYNLYRRIVLRNISKEIYLKAYLNIFKYPINNYLKLRCLFAGIRYTLNL